MNVIGTLNQCKGDYLTKKIVSLLMEISLTTCDINMIFKYSTFMLHSNPNLLSSNAISLSNDLVELIQLKIINLPKSTDDASTNDFTWQTLCIISRSPKIIPLYVEVSHLQKNGFVRYQRMAQQNSSLSWSYGWKWSNFNTIQIPEAFNDE